MSAPTDSSLENNPKEVQKATPEDYAHARPHTVAVDVFMQARRLFQQAEAANCTRKERVEKPLEFIAQFRVTEKSSLPKKGESVQLKAQNCGFQTLSKTGEHLQRRIPDSDLPHLTSKSGRSTACAIQTASLGYSFEETAAHKKMDKDTGAQTNVKKRPAQVEVDDLESKERNCDNKNTSSTSSDVADYFEFHKFVSANEELKGLSEEEKFDHFESFQRFKAMKKARSK